MKRCSTQGASAARWTLRVLPVCAAVLAVLGSAWGDAPTAQAQDAQWIWAREHRPGSTPPTMCHFRKTFQVRSPERAMVVIAADDHYDLFVNGRAVRTNASHGGKSQIDISRLIKRGDNVVAIRVSNEEGTTAGLAAQVQVKERGGNWVSHSTDESWKYNLSPFPFWNSPVYNDRGWASVQMLGPMGRTAPFDGPSGAPANTPTSAVATKSQPTPAAPVSSPAAAPAVRAAVETKTLDRFTIPDDFDLTEVVDSKTAGSLIAMTFNEFGHIVAAREGAGLILIFDKDRDGKYETLDPYCDKIKNCQGLLCLNGDVYATADGPDGAALYRLSDDNGDAILENVQTILKFRGEIGEHGPHGIALGPDGMLYIIVGNHASPDAEYDPLSPHRNYYEGDLVGPRYEDPGGHANGVKAPGGTVIRTDIHGKQVSLVAGGLRNAYDLVFNREGELFVHDSDMESDMGAAWYRPTRLYHVIPGSEFGWRSGWAKWPDYFVDSLPGVADTGRGSPTGAAVYTHHMFPARLHNAIFLGDWSEGRILAATLTRDGATYKAEIETFIEGRPMNVTDLEVGPDGSLYFCTGGRGTEGGLYRVTWKGKVPPNVRELGQGIEAAVRHPQLYAAWSRQEIARYRRDLGGDWERLVKGVARSKSNPWQYRARALNLMTLYGPRPDTAFLVTLAQDGDAELRAKAAEMLGNSKDPAARDQLILLLDDESARVRRYAAEGLTAQGWDVPWAKLAKMLASSNRHEAWAARRLLELSDPATYREQVLATDNHRLFIQGATAMLIAHPSKEHAEEIIKRTLTVMEGYVSDADFIDLLRVTQLALLRGGFTAADAPDVRQAIEREFPANHPIMNRELVRLLAYLDSSAIIPRYLAYLKSDKVEQIDKLHLAFHLRFIESGWTAEQRFELLEFYERAAKFEGGGSFERYVQNIATDFARTASLEVGREILKRGDEFPTSAVGVLYNLPAELDADLRAALVALDERVATQKGSSVERLKLGLVAVFARAGDAESMAYLRKVWERDPERRQVVAMGLAQQPGGGNWEYLLRSLPIVEGEPARVVLAMLRTVPYGPNDAEHYRQAILCGLRLDEQGAAEAVELLKYWTGGAVEMEDQAPEGALAAWQAWFHANYPDHPKAELPETAADSKYQFDELLVFLTGEESNEASAARGALVFEKAQCTKCHRYGTIGKSAGPDLTSIGKRFTKREILESILFPSHVISDQYATKSIITTGGRTFTGVVGSGGEDKLSVLTDDGRTITIEKDQVDEILPVAKSAMPEGLLNELELEDIADLFEFLDSATPTAVASPPRPTVVR